jgi:hypothetical protein
MKSVSIIASMRRRFLIANTTTLAERTCPDSQIAIELAFDFRCSGWSARLQQSFFSIANRGGVFSPVIHLNSAIANRRRAHRDQAGTSPQRKPVSRDRTRLKWAVAQPSLVARRSRHLILRIILS